MIPSKEAVLDALAYVPESAGPLPVVSIEGSKVLLDYSPDDGSKSLALYEARTSLDTEALREVFEESLASSSSTTLYSQGADPQLFHRVSYTFLSE